jgi:tetratricopeptide (TPR) repeat protein
LWREFEKRAADEADRKTALVLGEKLYETMHDDDAGLNNRAWEMLTEDRFGGSFNDLALKYSQRSNELTDHHNWYYLDTLALALFKTGDAQEAVEMEKKALALCNDASGRPQVEAALARFEAALKR